LLSIPTLFIPHVSLYDDLLTIGMVLQLAGPSLQYRWRSAEAKLVRSSLWSLCPRAAGEGEVLLGQSLLSGTLLVWYFA
jgi:hypothetical protein